MLLLFQLVLLFLVFFSVKIKQALLPVLKRNGLTEEMNPLFNLAQDIACLLNRFWVSKQPILFLLAPVILGVPRSVTVPKEERGKSQSGPKTWLTLKSTTFSSSFFFLFIFFFYHCSSDFHHVAIPLKTGFLISR